MGMNNFERQIEEECVERIEQACAVEREATALECLSLCLSAKSVGEAAKLISNKFSIAANSSVCRHTNQQPIDRRLIDGFQRVVFLCQICLAELIYEEPEDAEK
jgi:hypothetical protein